MKRRDVIKRLEANGWRLVRHGNKHDVYWNDEARRPIPVKRHTEIPDQDAREIFKQAGLEP